MLILDQIQYLQIMVGCQEELNFLLLLKLFLNQIEIHLPRIHLPNILKIQLLIFLQVLYLQLWYCRIRLHLCRFYSYPGNNIGFHLFLSKKERDLIHSLLKYGYIRHLRLLQYQLYVTLGQKF